MVHKTALIDPSATIGANVSIGPYSFVGKNVSIGDNTNVMAFSTIEADAKIGSDVTIYPHVVIYNGSLIHNNVHIYPHSVIGSNGFGYATDAIGVHHFIPQIGIAILHEGSHFGPSSFIDRAALDTSCVGKGSHIGAFSHIAHNSKVGDNARVYNDLIVAGSTKIGDNFKTSGISAVTGHIDVTDNVRLEAHSGVNNSEKNPGHYQGFPHEPVETFRERLENIKELYNLRKKVLRLKGFNK
ncbi:MAG: hypothetical protein KDD37_10210 [Bdellovibrionales bacterium]|nr:hypothetical protein [Bdellovibrionales bacterium]